MTTISQGWGVIRAGKGTTPTIKEIRDKKREAGFLMYLIFKQKDIIMMNQMENKRIKDIMVFIQKTVCLK